MKSRQLGGGHYGDKDIGGPAGLPDPKDWQTGIRKEIAVIVPISPIRLSQSIRRFHPHPLSPSPPSRVLSLGESLVPLISLLLSNAFTLSLFVDSLGCPVAPLDLRSFKSQFAFISSRLCPVLGSTSQSRLTLVVHHAFFNILPSFCFHRCPSGIHSHLCRPSQEDRERDGRLGSA